MNKNLLGLLVSGALVLAAPAVGLLVTALSLGGAFRSTASVDAAQKAHVLAQGISDSMNATAGGIVVSCLASVATAIFAVRLYLDSKRANAPK